MGAQVKEGHCGDTVLTHPEPRGQVVRVLQGVVVMGLAALILSGCSSEAEPAVMPDVVGTTLDVAKSDIERAGYTKSVEVLGGGMFGVIDESNWEVCEQLPAAGSVVDVEPRLTVDRSCGGDQSDHSAEPTNEESPEPETSSDESSAPEPEDDESEDEADSELPDASEIERVYLEHLHNNFIDDISDMCDAAYTHWACFYDGAENGAGYLRVNLTTDGGWSEDELDEMAAQAGRHWFNFVGCDFPQLGTIVVSINGLDHTVSRSDTMVDSTCED